MGLQQRLGFVGPLLGQTVLGFGPLELIEFFTQELCSAVKAPEVIASKVGKSGVLSEDVVTVTQIGWLSP